MSRSVKSELQIGMSGDKEWSLEMFVRECGVPRSNAEATVEHLIQGHCHVGRSRCPVPLPVDDTDSYRKAVGSKL